MAVSEPPPPVEQPQEQSKFRAWLERYAGWIWPVIIVTLVVLWLNGIRPVQTVFDWYEDLTALTLRFAEWLLEEYGYLAVFLVPLLENSFFLGLIVPGSVMLVFAGIGAQQGLIEWYLALPLAIAGAIIGDTLSYFAGRYGWVRVFGTERVERWKERWQETFLTHARWVIVTYHFLGYTRLIGPTAAGLLHLPYRRWAPLDYAGVTLWIIAFGGLGYVLGLLGLSLEDSEENVRIFEAIILFFVIAWFARSLFTSRQEEA